MENDEYLNQADLVEINNLESNNIFKLEYKGQLLKNNARYQTWKQSMIKKYGENPKQFKCLEDNILFYTNYENYWSFPSYKSKCPICKNQICYFCSNSKTNFPIDYVICCLKRKIYKLLFYDGLQYIKKIDDKDVKNIF